MRGRFSSATEPFSLRSRWYRKELRLRARWIAWRSMVNKKRCGGSSGESAAAKEQEALMKIIAVRDRILESLGVVARPGSAQGGFSLMEVTIAMAIVTILAGAALPKVFELYESRLIERTATEAHYLQEAAKNYYTATGSWPADVAALQATGYIPSGWTPNNPWGYAYAVSNNGTSFSVSVRMPTKYNQALNTYLPNVVVDIPTDTTTTTTPIPGMEPSLSAFVMTDGSRPMTGDLRVNKTTPAVNLVDAATSLGMLVSNDSGSLLIKNNSGGSVMSVDQGGNATITGAASVGGAAVLAGTPPPSPVPGSGAIYVNNADNKLYYMDQSGNITALGEGLWEDQVGYIRAKNAPSVVVTDAGALGIGTTNPQAALHTVGGVVVQLP